MSELIERAALQVRIAFNQRVDIATELTEDEAKTLARAVLESLLPVDEGMVQAMLNKLDEDNRQVTRGYITADDVTNAFTAAIRHAADQGRGGE